MNLPEQMNYGWDQFAISSRFQPSLSISILSIVHQTKPYKSMLFYSCLVENDGQNIRKTPLYRLNPAVALFPLQLL